MMQRTLQYVGPRFVIPSIYERGPIRTVPLKCGKFATKYPWIYGYFYSSVLCIFMIFFKTAFTDRTCCALIGFTFF